MTKCHDIINCSISAAALGLLMVGSGEASGAYGPWNASAGPQIAWSWGRASGASFGWEAGGGIGVVRLNVGQSYYSDATLSYAALEPYLLYVGGTLGIGHESHYGLFPVLGIWEGAPVVYPDECEPDRRARFGLFLTVAAGYRYGAGRHQVYISPKAGLSQSLTACTSAPTGE